MIQLRTFLIITQTIITTCVVYRRDKVLRYVITVQQWTYLLFI